MQKNIYILKFNIKYKKNYIKFNIHRNMNNSQKTKPTLSPNQSYIE